MCMPFSHMVTEMRLKTTFTVIIPSPFSRLKGEISSCVSSCELKAKVSFLDRPSFVYMDHPCV